MFVRYLRIKNFKKIRNREFNFDGPLTVLTGGNASGKTAVIEAITWLLGDHLQENIADYINWDTDENMELSVRFDHNDVVYEYDVLVKQKGGTERTLKLSTEPGTLYKNSDCIKKIKELYNQKLLLYSCIASQHEGTSILFEKPTERLTKFKQILELEKLEDISAAMKEELVQLEAKSTALDNEKGLLEKSQFHFQPVPDLPQIDTTAITLLEKEEQEYQNKLDEFRLAQSKKQEQERLKLRRIELGTQIKKAQEDIAKLVETPLPAIDTAREAQARLELTSIREAANQYKVDHAKYEAYAQSLKSLNDKKDSLIKRRDDVVVRRLASCAITTEGLAALSDLINAEAVSEKTLKGHLALAKEGKCSTCGQDFAHDPAKLEADLKQVHNALNQLRADYVRDKTLLDKYERDKADNATALENKAFYNKEIEQIDEALGKLTVVQEPARVDSILFTQLEKEVTAFDQMNTEFKRVKALNDSLESSRSKHRDTISRAEGELSQIVISDIEAIMPVFENQAKLDQLRKDVLVYDERKRAIAAAEKFNEQIKESKKANDTKIAQVVAEIDKTLERHRLVQEARKVIDKEFSSYLIDEGSTLIKNKMNEFFSKTYGKFFVDFKRDNKSVSFFYTPDSETYRPVGVASGFERQALSLSFRVALSSLQDLRFYILDEADSSAEDGNSIQMYSNLLAQKYEQIICVTHKESTKEYLINECNANFFEM